MVATIYYRGKTVLLTAVALVVIGVPWYLVVQKLRNAEPVDSPARPSAVFWGGRYFPNSAQLSRWLHYRGAGYAVWASRHRPAAARIGRG